MGYLVTGATGFIGGRLVARLLERDGTIHCLTRPGSRDRLERRVESWGAGDGRVVPVVGDLTESRLGVDDATVERLAGEVTDVFHVAAVYDMEAEPAAQRAANVTGTRQLVELVDELQPDRLHHVSSVAVAGADYEGTFAEDTPLSAAEGLDHPYFATKHAAEEIVRREATVPWRVYRPGVVVGDSATGRIDKIDGPYYVFTLIRRLRSMLPPWFPLVGLEGRTLNLVPVDYVVAAMDHIAHLPEPRWDGRAYHLVDRDPHTVGELLNIFAGAAHAPRFQMRIDPEAAALIPDSVRRIVGSLPFVRNTRQAVLDDLGIPEEVLRFLDWPAEFDDAGTRAALEGTGIEPPPLEDYAWRLWDHWERHLDPALHHERTLADRVADATVLITGASGGIGRAAALKVGRAGGHVLLVARTADKLEAVADEIEADGGTASVHPGDLSDMDDIDRLCTQILAEHGTVDVLVNNAGRSIRRSVRLSFDRFHDYERTMQLNYFGVVKLVLNLLPRMMETGGGHIVNVSSIGVQTNTPRFSAYVASKAATDAFSRCIASEIIDDGVHVTTVYMPLVRTPMIEPTRIYDYFPTISPEAAAGMITDAIVNRPKKVATGLGNFGQVMYAAVPKLVDQVLHTGYRMFPDSAAAKGRDPETEGESASSEGLAFAHLLKGVHW